MTMAQGISFETYRGSAADNYQRYFVPAIGAPLAANLIDLAALRAGERVADIACGTGVVTRLAAERVGAEGAVVGVDVNPEMLAVARGAAADSAIDWYEARADALPLPDGAFDVALCQLGLQFFPDKPIALLEMRRVLADGGRALINVPGPTPGVFTVLDEALARHVSPEASGFVRAVFSLHDPDEVRELLSGAGFDAVEARSTLKALRLPAPEQFLWQYVQSTPLEAAAARLDQEQLTALERDVVAGWEPYTDDGGLLLEVNVTVATARASR
jgi:ubiquinone/menaquinone biosynthesis C-methylase UbiE